MERAIPISQSRILVCGVARNCENSLAKSIQALSNATRFFHEVRFHIVESDSADRTPQILDDLGKLYPLTFQSEGKLCRVIPSRTSRIAHCRNQLVELAKTPEFESFEYVLMADLDGVNNDVHPSVLANCWNIRTPWDVLTANQPEGYYDVWALRCEGWLSEDCWVAARELEPVFGKKIAIEMAVRSRQIRIPASTALIEVDSAFGGLGLYRRAAFISGHYTGSTPEGTDICEHVPFHADLRNAGFRIFINPALVNSSPSEHLAMAPSTGGKLLQKLWRKR